MKPPSMLVSWKPVGVLRRSLPQFCKVASTKLALILSTNKLHDVNRPKEGAGGQGFTPPKGNERRESGSPSGAAKYFEGELGSNLSQTASTLIFHVIFKGALYAG